MKRFLIRIAVFLIPMILATIFCELYMRSYKTQYDHKNEGVLAKLNDIELIVVGNSHALNDVNPQQFDLPAYNLAAGNQSLYFDKRIVLKYLDSLKSLKYVMITVDYHSLYFSSQGIRDIWSYYTYDIAYKDQSYVKESISYFWFGFTPRVTGSIMKEQLLQYINRNNGEHQLGLVDGWQPARGTILASFEEKQLQARANYFNGVVHDGSGEYEEIKKDLEDFIVELRAFDITPILVTSPISPQLHTLLNQEIVASNKEYIENLSMKYDLVYWNMADSISESTYYNNNDHLNVEGANKYSQMLNELLQLNFYAEADPK